MPKEWIGPALGPDSAAELTAAMGRLSASRLREFAPQPFGLISDQPRLPAFAGYHSHSPEVPVMRMTLCYGIPEDPLSPYIEVSTDFAPGHKETAALRFELGKAVGQHNARLTGERQHGGRPHRPPPGPLGRGRVEIVVAGSPRTARTQIYRDFHGLQFTHPGLLVTVIARGRWPDRPEFALVTDLEPYLAARESADSEVIRARIRARSGPPA